MTGIPLTLTCGDYEITRLLAEGAVTADGIDLTVLTDIASRDRHWRLARNGECDAGEFNAFGYFMAKERGHPFIALPVFPHRRFRHGFVFVNPTKGIRSPRDLIGRRIGVEGYQTAGCVWMKGILEEFFGVPHREITWVLPRPEDIPFTPPPGLRIEYAAGDKTDEEMLIGGEIDAVITPQVPAHFRRGDKRIARLFPNYKELEVDYFRRTGIFPIMHLVVISREIVDRHPWIPANLARAFHVAKNDLRPHPQPARRSARVVRGCMGGAGRTHGPRPLGLRAHRGEPQHSCDGTALCARAGLDLSNAGPVQAVHRHP